MASTLSAVGLVAAVTFGSSRALAQYPEPPAEYVATTEPVYYEGHAAYWYGNHWYYRDAHGAWGHYDNEPAFLADRRMHSPPPRHNYNAHPAGHYGRR